MFELQGDKGGLEHAQKKEGNERRQQAPENCVHNDRRADLELEEQCPAEHDKAQNENAEHGGPVAGIGECKAQTAALAGVAQHEAAAKEAALSAARTARLEAGSKHRGLRRIVLHDEAPAWRSGPSPTWPDLGPTWARFGRVRCRVDPGPRRRKPWSWNPSAHHPGPVVTTRLGASRR